MSQLAAEILRPSVDRPWGCSYAINNLSPWCWDITMTVSNLHWCRSFTFILVGVEPYKQTYAAIRHGPTPIYAFLWQALCQTDIAQSSMVLNLIGILSQILSYQYRNQHHKDTTVWRRSCVYNGNSIPGKSVFMMRPIPVSGVAGFMQCRNICLLLKCLTNSSHCNYSEALGCKLIGFRQLAINAHFRGT